MARKSFATARQGTPNFLKLFSTPCSLFFGFLVFEQEKEGVPAEFLRAVCGTVEIPQLGIIRSLNVHVSAAIFLAQAFLASE